ncbi:hypothetical protein EV363DRAFT_1379496 [Boletus edulis]|nr:hypothetical protein EV363DRAFT_1379496 [Boletus edulis]
MKCRRRARGGPFWRNEQIYAARSWDESVGEEGETHGPSVGLTRRFACLQPRHGHLVQACRRTRTTSRRCCHRRLCSYNDAVGFAGFQLPRSTSTRPAPKPVYPPPTLNTVSGSPLSTRSRLLCHTYKRDSGAHPQGRLVGWTCRRRRLLGRRVGASRHVYTHVHIHPKFRVENVARRGYVANPINTFCTLGTTLHEPRGWFPPASYIRDGKTKVVLTGVWVGDVDL